MHLLLDCDPGHDDMLAILLAAKHLDVIGITTVHGNQSVEKTTANALKILELADLDIPVSQGLSKPLLGDAVHAPQMHGESGLDGAELPEPTRSITEASAVQTIIEASRRYDDLVVVPTGPLTNVAAALILDPSLTTRITEISLMGGSLSFGNWTPAAEFNIWADPEAADIVFRSGIPIRMFGLNVTRRAAATTARIQDIRDRGSRVSGVVADLLAFYSASSKTLYGLSGASLHDPLAIATLIKPELFVLQDLHVAIELSGTLTRGMTVCDIRHASTPEIQERDAAPRGEATNAQVAVDVDVDGFFDLLADTLGQYA